MKREDLKVGETYQNTKDKTWTRTILMITASHVFYSCSYSYKSAGYTGEAASRIDAFIDGFEPIKKDFYHVYYFRKQAQRPTCHAQLFESKEDFLTRVGQDKEEFYHWIKLVRVDV